MCKVQAAQQPAGHGGPASRPTTVCRSWLGGAALGQSAWRRGLAQTLAAQILPCARDGSRYD